MWGLERKWVNTRLSPDELSTAMLIGKDLDQGLHTCLALLPALINQIDLSQFEADELLLLIEWGLDFNPEELTKAALITGPLTLIETKRDELQQRDIDGDKLAQKLRGMSEAQALGLYAMTRSYQFHPPEGETEIELFLRFWLSPPQKRLADGLDRDYWQLRP